ncbi:hypothetical protein MY10362_006040 [Beauveria mimosiformis]
MFIHFGERENSPATLSRPASGITTTSSICKEQQQQDVHSTYELSYRPTGDLWLARRPYGGQGFWVLSESIGSTDEREIIPIAAFSFAVAEADSIYARPVQQSPETYALQQLLEWDTQCKQHHECYPASRAVPRYLVDLGRSKSEESVELVQLGAGDAKYTALSYTSDCRSEVQWRPDNSDAEKITILTTDLPKMFRDAILVTRTLGVRYIWIDSLCIPGNAPEWERDSEEIGSVCPEATISGTQVTLEDDAKPFGNVASASIVIAAPVVPLKLVEKGGQGRHIFLRTEDGHEDGFYAGFDFIDRQYEASAEGIRDSKLFALVLANTRRDGCLTGSCHIASLHNLLGSVMSLVFILSSSIVSAPQTIIFSGPILFAYSRVGAVFVTAVAATLVYQGEDAAKTGFIITLALQLKAVLGGTTTMFNLHDLLARTIVCIVSLANVETESRDGNEPARSWPAEAKIEVCDLAVRYDASAQPALREVNYSVESRQRLGIVGRAGSGKTILTNAILRFIAVAQGQIIIDSDRFRFSGTLQANVDLSGTKSDSLVLEVLRRVHLIPTAATTDVDNHTSEFFHLDMEIQPGGVNLSYGQLQLLCLARALFVRCPILIVDEATSGGHDATDAAVQRVLREEFSHATILVVAHRLLTVADFDSILVMRDGKVAEIGPPRALTAK